MLQALSQRRWICAAMLAFTAAGSLTGEPDDAGKATSKWAYQVDVWTYYTNQDVRTNSPYNPGNLIAGRPRDVATFELRPDFHWNKSGFASFDIGPRFTEEYRSVEQGSQSRKETTALFFVNRWDVEVSPLDKLDVKIGRSSLVWGPALFRSPGNPFSFDNGRDDPTAELPGKDYAEADYRVSSQCSLSAISNFGRGRMRDPNGIFKPTQAMKVDWVGENYMVSATLSKRTGDPLRASGFGQWTASPAVLAYAEWSVGGRNRGYYPEEGGPTGGFAESRRESTPATALLGGSYTFISGHVLSLEGLVNNQGYTAEEARGLRSVLRASVSSLDFPLWAPFAYRNFGNALNNNLALQRRHYLFIELKNPIGGTYLWNGRYTQNLDDGSGQLSAYFETNVTDHAQVFLLVYRNFGPSFGEFRQLADFEGRVGVHFVF